MFYLGLSFLQLLEGLRTDTLNKIFELVTMLGEETLMILIVVTLWFAFDKGFAQRIAFLSCFSLGINSVVKNFTKVPRPFMTGKVTCVRPDTATGYSFPSGHTHNFATWSTIFALHVKKLWFAIFTAILIVLVGFSRMFLGAHYPGDVIVGGVLGVVIAIVGSIIYDKVENKRKLYIAAIIALTPFAVLFIFNADPLFGDFYKIYGMLIGLIVAIMFEEKYAPLTYDVCWWKKLIRIVIGVVIAYVFKEVVKKLGVSPIVQLSFVVDILRYIVLVFLIFGLCPVLFKKCKI
ncbi:MAG: phosphatase PAP2 family protein [Clostridia bacterium]|nr:phosphatase PAP2 family protein [Clostridia bacterium]